MGYDTLVCEKLFWLSICINDFIKERLANIFIILAKKINLQLLLETNWSTISLTFVEEFAKAKIFAIMQGEVYE